MCPSEREETAISEPDGQAGKPANTFFKRFATICEVMEAARIGVWCWDIKADRVTWSRNLEAVRRMPPGTFDGTFAAFRRDVHPEDWAAVEAAIQEALRTKGPYRVRYRTRPRDDGEECWLESDGTVVAKDGVPQRLQGLCFDVTGRVELEAELRSRIKQQEALAQLGERALGEPDLERLLDDAVNTVAQTLSVDFVKVLELLPGNGDLLLRAGFGWKSDLVCSVVASTGPNSYGRHTLNSPLPVITPDYAEETRFVVDAYLHEHRCRSGVTVTIVGRDERAYGILGICTRTKRHFTAQETSFLRAVADILAGVIARRQLEQRHELMIRDMRHRSGNMFSQLLALFSQTARNSKNIPDLAKKYQARVLALANAHRLITEGGWKSIPLMDLLYTVLGPYLDRITFDGPNVELEPDPVFNLSAALHELADNAVKYGSLSHSKGRLDLSWSVIRTGRGVTLVLDWVERDGAKPMRAGRPGFGSRLISLVIERQLNGEVVRNFSRQGLSVHMVVPLTHERWPTAAPGPVESARA